MKILVMMLLALSAFGCCNFCSISQRSDSDVIAKMIVVSMGKGSYDKGMIFKVPFSDSQRVFTLFKELDSSNVGVENFNHKMRLVSDGMVRLFEVSSSDSKMVIAVNSYPTPCGMNFGYEYDWVEVKSGRVVDGRSGMFVWSALRMDIGEGVACE